MTNKRINQMVLRAKAIQGHLSQVKPLYGELDQITMALLPYQDHAKKYGMVIIDKYADKVTNFKTVAISRYEIQWVPK